MDNQTQHCALFRKLDVGKGHDKYHERVGFKLEYILPVYVVLLTLCVLGNAIVCYTIARNKKLWKTCYYLVVNLAVADVGFSSLVSLMVLQYNGVQFNEYGCKFSIFSIDVFLGTATLSLGFISIDRYYNICHSDRQGERRFKARYIIAGTWLASVIIYFPELYGCTASMHKDVLSCDCYSIWNGKKEFYIFYGFATFLVGYFLPAAAMVICYVRIFLKLRKSDPLLRSAHGTGVKRKGMRMIVAATILFLLSWGPYNVMDLIKKFEIKGSKIFGNVWLFANLLGFANSTFNPYVYAIFNQNFRESFRKVCCRKKKPVQKRLVNLARENRANSHAAEKGRSTWGSFENTSTSSSQTVSSSLEASKSVQSGDSCPV